MVTTVLEARVKPERWEELKSKYTLLTTQLPPQLLGTALLQSREDPNLWRISTDWVSMEGLREYRDSVETPDGVRLFREVGADPGLSVFEVVATTRSGVDAEAPESARTGPAASGSGL